MTNSWKNRVTAAVATLAIAASMLPVNAFAADSDLKLDKSITVSGLVEGDTVQYYQIIEQDTTTGAWKFTEAVDKSVKADGEEVAKQDGKIDGSEYTLDSIVITKAEQGTELITWDMANAIAVALSKNKATEVATGTADESGKVVLSKIGDGEDAKDLPAGLYMVVASPGENNKNVIYKPIFVSADYYETDPDKTDSRNVGNKDENKYYEDKGVFKKSELKLDKLSGEYDKDGKLVDAQRDVSVGDVVDFTIKAPLPTFTKNYEDAVYTISDELTKGLELDANSIKVTLMDTDGKTELTDQPEKGESADGSGDYIVTVADDGQSFTVAFQNDKNRSEDANKDNDKKNDKDGFLYTVVGNPTVVITYQAKVLETAATEQVNEEDNTAKLNFSNNPKDTKGEGKLEDKTRHYTFDIDANIFGQGENPNGEKTSEIRKVRMEADGTIKEEITTTEIKGDNAPENMKWLEDAEFELKMISEFKQTEDNRTGEMVNLAEPEVINFKGGMKCPAGTEGATGPKSDENGYIPMKGLDAGVYQLKETKAPAGYAFTPKVYTITIMPTYVDDAATDGNQVLQKYVVTVAFTGDNNKDHTNSSTYWVGQNNDKKPIELTNEKASVSTTNPETEKLEENTTTLIVNKKLGILPSTGGSGIYFYLGVGGAIAAGSAYLIHRTKKQEELLAK